MMFPKNYEKTLEGFVCELADLEKEMSNFANHFDRIWDAADCGDLRKVKRLCDDAKVYGHSTLSDVQCRLVCIGGTIQEFYETLYLSKEENERLLSEVENLKEFDSLLRKMDKIRRIVED